MFKNKKLSDTEKEKLKMLSIQTIGRESKFFNIENTQEEDVFRVDCSGMVERSYRPSATEDLDYIGYFYVDKNLDLTRTPKADKFQSASLRMGI